MLKHKKVVYYKCRKYWKKHGNVILRPQMKEFGPEKNVETMSDLKDLIGTVVTSLRCNSL